MLLPFQDQHHTSAFAGLHGVVQALTYTLMPLLPSIKFNRVLFGQAVNAGTVGQDVFRYPTISTPFSLVMFFVFLTLFRVSEIAAADDQQGAQAY